MARAGDRNGRGAILIALGMVGGLLTPSTANAVDDASLVLPGSTLTAVTADLDEDGEREVIRVVQGEEAPDQEVDVWSHDAATWSMIGSIRLPSAGPGAVRSGLGNPVALLPWSVAGRDRVLVLTAQLLPDDPNGATCCLAVAELELTPAGAVDLRLIQQIDTAAQSFFGADVDGDGSDELVLHENDYGTGAGDETATLTVLRWTGSRFDPIFEGTDQRWLYGFTLAESDGVAGDDFMFAPTADGSLQRLAWVDGALRAEEAHLDLGGPDEGWVAGVAGGTIMVSLVDEVRAIGWPRGERAVVINSLPTLSYPGLMLLGDGPDALVALQEGLGFESGDPPTVTIHDLELRRLGEVPVGPGTEAFWSIASGRSGLAWSTLNFNVWPYTGPLHGIRIDGRSAFAASGMLIQAGGPAGYVARPMASLIGMQPIGTAGPDDAWAVLSDAYGPGTGSAYLIWGGVPIGTGRLALTPVDQLLRPDDEVGIASFELIDAVEVGGRESAAVLMADGEGFRVAVTAAEGATVLVASGSRLEDHQVGDEPLVVDIGPRSSGPDHENQEFEAMIVVITPDGRGTTKRLTGTFVRELPEISLTATTDGMALSATLVGRATPGSTVTANGRTIRTDDGGRFEASLDAPIWPTNVVVTAHDPLGNEATELVEVVGLVDYRGLPWAGIMIVATIIVGGVLYVRTPKLKRSAAVATPDGDGRLEELELGSIDGIEPGGR